MRIRSYLFLTLSTALLIPFCFYAGLQYYAVEHRLARNDQDTKIMTQTIAAKVEVEVNQAKQAIGVAARFLAVVGTKNSEQLSGYLKALHQAMPEFINVHFGNAGGVSVAFWPQKNAQGQSNLGVNHHDRPHWLRVRGTAEPYVSDVFRGVGGSTALMINVGAESRDKDGKVVGYAVGALNPKDLAEQALEGIGTGQALVWILDGNGVPIFSNDGADPDKPVLPFKVLRSLKSGTPQPVQISREEGQELVGFVEKIKDMPWLVAVFHNRQDQTAQFFTWFSTYLTVLLIGLGLAFLVSAWFVRPLERSLRTLSEELRKGSMPSEEVGVGDPQEVKELKLGIRELLSKLQNARHEVKDLRRRLRERS